MCVCGVDSVHMTLEDLEVDELLLTRRQQVVGGDGPSIFKGNPWLNTQYKAHSYWYFSGSTTPFTIQLQQPPLIRRRTREFPKRFGPLHTVLEHRLGHKPPAVKSTNTRSTCKRDSGRLSCG